MASVGGATAAAQDEAEQSPAPPPHLFLRLYGSSVAARGRVRASDAGDGARAGAGFSPGAGASGVGAHVSLSADGPRDLVAPWTAELWVRAGAGGGRAILLQGASASLLLRCGAHVDEASSQAPRGAVDAGGASRRVGLLLCSAPRAARFDAEAAAAAAAAPAVARCAPAQPPASPVQAWDYAVEPRVWTHLAFVATPREGASPEPGPANPASARAPPPPLLPPFFAYSLPAFSSQACASTARGGCRTCSSARARCTRTPKRSSRRSFCNWASCPRMCACCLDFFSFAFSFI